MKYRILTAVLFLTLSLPAQINRFEFAAGFHGSTASQYLLDNADNAFGSQSYNQVLASMARGASLQLRFHRQLKNWLALGLGLRALQTVPAVKGRNHVEFVDYYYHETTKWNSTLVNLTPGFTIQVPEHTLQPYAGFFFLLPVYARLKTEGDYQYSSFGGPVGSGTIKTRYRLRHSLGFQTTAGIATQSRKGMSWFAEMSICTQSVLLKKSTITSDIRNGVETIGQYTRYARETDYVKELVAQSRPATTDEPQQKLSFPIPYSSIGLQGGIRIKL